MASEAMHANIDPLSNAQMRRRPFNRSQPRASRPLEITHVDVLQVSQRDLPSHVDGNKIGYKYGAIFIDDYSKHSRVYFAKTKAEIPRLIRCYYNDMGTSALFGTDLVLGPGFAQNCIHTDGGKELNSAEVQDILSEFGLAANVTSAPDSPSSNGIAERNIQTLFRGAVYRLTLSGISARHWHWAVNHASSCRNKLASQLVPGSNPRSYVTPHELFYGKPPDTSHCLVFGAPCRVLLLGPSRVQRGKLGLPCDQGCVLAHCADGIQEGYKIRRILGYAVLLDSGNIVYSRHVEIDERRLLQGGVAASSPPEPLLPADIAVRTESQMPLTTTSLPTLCARHRPSRRARPLLQRLALPPLPPRMSVPLAACHSAWLPHPTCQTLTMPTLACLHTHTLKQQTSSSSHTIRCAAIARRAAAHVPLPTCTLHGRSLLTLLSHHNTTWLLCDPLTLPSGARPALLALSGTASSAPLSRRSSPCARALFRPGGCL
jgi:hypothetical protein